MSFKSNFEEICAEKGTTPTAVCNAVGITASAYSQWTDRTMPRKTTIIKIANHLNVTTDYLLGKATKVLTNSYSSIQEICDRIKKCCKVRFITEKELCKQIGEDENYLELLRKGEKSICLDDISKMCDVFDISANYLLFGRISNKAISPSIPMRDILNKCEERQIDILDVMQDTGLPMDMFVLIDNNYAPVGKLCWTIQNPIIDKYPYSTDCIMELKEAYKRPECKYIILDKSDAELSIAALNDKKLSCILYDTIDKYCDAGKIDKIDATVQKDKSHNLVKVH